MVLGKRGMRRVHLVEAAAEIGGTMRWIPQLPGLGEWARLVNYRKIQLDKLANVELILSTTLSAGDVAEYGAEIVVVATGSYWATDGLNGSSHDIISGADASLPWQATPDQLLGEGKTLAGERIVLFDNDGYFMGVSIAEKLALEGKKVTMLTPLGHIAPYMHFTLEAPNMHRRLHSLGVEIVPYHLPTRIEEGAVVASHVYDEHGAERTWEADGVVLVSQRRSNELLYRALKDEIGLDKLREEGVQALYRIGDCEAPRLIADAVFSGHRLAREIDAPDPSIPLPFRRERRLVTAESVAAEKEWYAGVNAGAA